MVQALPTASRAGSSYSPADGGLSTSSRWRGPVVARYSISGPAIEASPSVSSRTNPRVGDVVEPQGQRRKDVPVRVDVPVR